GRYCSQWFGDTTFSASPTVTIAPDYVTSGIDAVMDRSSSISGNVQRANVAPAWVNAIGVWPQVYRWDVDEGAWTEANDTGLQEPTDASGNYTVTGLDAGQYKIRFVPDTSYLTFNHFIADQVYGAPTGAKLSPSSPAEWPTYEAQLSAGTTITLAANTDLTGIDDQCPWGGYLTGRVTYAAGGAPVPDYHVSVWDTSGLTFVGDTWTDASGNWEFRDLDDVPDYKVMFDDESGSLTGGDPGYFYNTEWYNGAGSPAAATSVGFGPGSGMAAINAAIDSTTQWGDVTGKVTDMHTGKALEGVTVGLNLWNTDTPGWVEQHSTTTDASGRYTFTKVPWAAPFNSAVRISAYEDESNT
ncbi:MAG: carboxypeptidase-like regulatory domain-containing protein, partial [Actinobacteria bacterium]